MPKKSSWTAKVSRKRKEPKNQKAETITKSQGKNLGTSRPIKTHPSSENKEWYEWYTDNVKRYWNFNGRARRKEFWMFWLMELLIFSGIGFFEGLNDIPSLTADPLGPGFLAFLYMISLIPVRVGLWVRRLHDTGHNGLWFLVPVWPTILMFLDGQTGENKYGLNPKNR